MVGRDVTLKVEKGAANPGEVALQIEGLKAKNHRGVEALRGVSFRVRKGEIVGIAGVDGNGQTELIECMTGLRKAAGGKVVLNGKNLTGLRPGAIRDAGLGHIPEDRHARGLVLDFTVAENAILGEQRKFSHLGLLNFAKMKQRAADAIKHFDVRPPEPEYLARKLSGGNQQKVIVGREVLRGPDLLIAAQPTRGLDVGAIEFIHKRLVAERDAGKAVLLVSLELDEVMALADRILVMYKGEVVAEMPAAEATEAKLGLLMAGGAVHA
jgi:simple sugar transport system ATP-binding protein